MFNVFPSEWKKAILSLLTKKATNKTLNIAVQFLYFLSHSSQHTFPLTKNGMKSQSPPPFCSPKRNEKKISLSFHPFPHLDSEINFPLGPGTSRTISTLKMSQTVETLISDLVLIVN